jgi:hypothetical protein
MFVAARQQLDLDYNNWSWPNFQSLANTLRTNDAMAP